MRDKDEYVYGDPQVKKNWIILFLIYVLFLLWLEPIIDFLLSARGPDMELAAIQAFNQKKEYIATVAFGVARSLPILIFLWLGYQVMLQGRLPPRGIKLPITIKVTKGQNARMLGMLIIVTSLVLLFRELNLLLSVQPV